MAYPAPNDMPAVSRNSLPLVTVAVPCLNRARYLAPTLDSILNQSYPAIECIVVDGGSTDGTIDILKSYGSRLKWVSEPDNGHADAINKGWRMGKGEILAWLNADDVWKTPDGVSLAVSYFAEHPEVDIVYGRCGRIDAAGRLTGECYVHDWDLYHAVVHCDHCIPQAAAFVRRTVLERVGFLDEDFYQKKDHEFWLRAGLACTIRHIPVTLAFARAIPGLSQRGWSAARACLQVTRKFYTLPGVPEEFWAARKRAFSNSHLRAMVYAFEGGHLWNLILWHAFWGIVTDPSNAPTILSKVRYLAFLERRDLLIRSRPVVRPVLNWLRRTGLKREDESACL